MFSLPLFPLSRPLYPQQRIELQVFEPRYLALVSDCLRQGKSFGVVQIREGKEVGRAAQVFQFGVEAKIVDWDQLPNGLLGITVEGARKFSIASTEVADDELMLAQVNWLNDEPASAIPYYYDGLEELLDQLLQHPTVQALGLPPVHDSRQLGWQLCQLLPLSAPDRIALLSLDDPLIRLEYLAERVARLSEE